MTQKKYQKLQPGDRIQFIQIPETDQQQFNQTGDDFTIRVLQNLIETKAVVMIDYIDEYGYPWFNYQMEDEEEAGHCLAVMSDDGWRRIEKNPTATAI